MPTRYITASIPYVNAVPHIGHALEFVQVDFLLRYYRAQGENVRGQFGSDDNSLKNVRAAQAAGEETEAYVARHSQVFKELQELLGLSFDDFIRTREDRHMRGAQKLWSLMKPEDVYKKSYQGLYCVGCEAFYNEADLVEGLCPVHKKALETVTEENYFFRLSSYQKQLEELVASDKIKVWPENRKNEMLAFIRRGLEDFSISRSVERAEHWGVPVPNDPSQVMYVWVDALSNYINALGFADDDKAYDTFWKNADVRTHVLGKDISRFHVIYWPAFLLSAGQPLPTEIFVHGFLTVDGQKMSKSLGNVIAPADLVADFGVEAVRYALLRELPLSNDGDIGKARMEERYAELANNLGNLVGRVAAMANKYFEGAVDDIAFHDADALTAKLKEAVARYDFRTYIELVWSVVDAANHKIDVEAPFKTAKTDLAACKKTLSELAGMIRFIAEALKPVIPNAAAEISKRYTGEKLTHGEPLFPRRDQEKV
ncbi:methionine--tRNA ligase [Patescibacteria group bacterium]|nr:methionine--tRNA ligase [Patescibacteria group bacterium]